MDEHYITLVCKRMPESVDVTHRGNTQHGTTAKGVSFAMAKSTMGSVACRETKESK